MKTSKPYRVPENAIKAFLTRPTLKEIVTGAANFFNDAIEAELLFLGVPVLNGGPHEGQVLYCLMEGDKIYFGNGINGDSIANDNRHDHDKAA